MISYIQDAFVRYLEEKSTNNSILGQLTVCYLEVAFTLDKCNWIHTTGIVSYLKGCSLFVGAIMGGSTVFRSFDPVEISARGWTLGAAGA